MTTKDNKMIKLNSKPFKNSFINNSEENHSPAKKSDCTILKLQFLIYIIALIRLFRPQNVNISEQLARQYRG